MNRKKWMKRLTIVSIISYIIAFFIKIIGEYLGGEYLLLMKVVMIFVFIGVCSSGLIGILNDGFWFKGLGNKSTHNELTSEEVKEIRKAIEDNYTEK